MFRKMFLVPAVLALALASLVLSATASGDSGADAPKVDPNKLPTFLSPKGGAFPLNVMPGERFHFTMGVIGMGLGGDPIRAVTLSLKLSPKLRPIRHGSTPYKVVVGKLVWKIHDLAWGQTDREVLLNVQVNKSAPVGRRACSYYSVTAKGIIDAPAMKFCPRIVEVSNNT